MKHLILGGGGFIGSHLCKRLLNRGHEVTTCDVTYPKFRRDQYFDSYGLFTYNEAEKYQADLRSPGRTRGVLQSKRWDVVWQLAADMGGVEYFHSDRDWAAALNNQIINVNVMKAVVEFAPQARVIFTSTACALDVSYQTHENEKHMWSLVEEDLWTGKPDQLYGQEKRNSAILWNAAPIDTRVAFLHTVYGPYQEHSGIRMKFPSAVAQKARKARETGRIEVFGDGRQIRSYLYVDDAVDRLLVLGESERNPGFVNIGSTIPYTVDHVAAVAVAAAGVKRLTSIVHIDGPTGVEARSANMDKFNNFYSYHDMPTLSLDKGMSTFINWLDKVDK